MAWAYLLIAGACEIIWAVGLKYSAGFTAPLPSIVTVVGMILSVGLLGFAVREIPLGTAYAVWTAVGTVGAAILGMILFHEPATALRLGCIGLIVLGTVGLKAFG